MTTKAADGLRDGAASSHSLGTSRFLDLILGWTGAGGVAFRLRFSVFFCRLLTALPDFGVEVPELPGACGR